MTAKERRERTISIAVFVFTLIFSILYVVIGNKIATGGITEYLGEDIDVLQGEIIQITDRTDAPNGENVGMKVEITRGERKGETVYAVLQISEYTLSNLNEATVGDEVILYTNGDENVNADWMVAGFERFTAIIPTISALFICWKNRE